jgi:glycosyltransferase involved in cell wall biosynthesis
MKTLTIVICNFNHERYLGEAVASALAQDYPATSVLVIDDGSTDRSVDIIASFGSRVQAVFKANGGQVSAYNLAIELVSSDYAIFLDADDVLYPNAVSEVVRAFEAGEYAKVQFRLDVIAAQGERTGSHVPHSDPPADCARLLRRGWLYPSPPASGNAYCLRALRRVFPVPESKDTRYGADFYAIYGVALVGNVLPIAVIGFTMRPCRKTVSRQRVRRACGLRTRKMCTRRQKRFPSAGASCKRLRVPVSGRNCRRHFMTSRLRRPISACECIGRLWPAAGAGWRWNRAATFTRSSPTLSGVSVRNSARLH